MLSSGVRVANTDQGGLRIEHRLPIIFQRLSDVPTPAMAVFLKTQQARHSSKSGAEPMEIHYAQR